MFYQLPNTRDTRSTSFGYGNTVDLSKQNLVTPAPGSYKTRGEFEKQKDENRGISFGLGREVTGAQSRPHVGRAYAKERWLCSPERATSRFGKQALRRQPQPKSIWDLLCERVFSTE